MYKKTLIFLVLIFVLSGCSNTDSFEKLNTEHKLELDQLAQIYRERINELEFSIEEKESEINDLQNDKVKIMDSNQLTIQFDQINELEIAKYRFILDGIYSEEESNSYFESETESIDGIRLGSNMSDVLKNLWYGFELIISDDGFDPQMNYTGLYISIHPTNYHVTGIYINDEGHKTHEGVQVGDNAIEVISKYKEKYVMNENEVLLPEYPEHIFKLEEEIFIQFTIDTEVAQDDSKITAIRLFKLGYPEY